jgi:hypothetical protein
LVGYEWDQIVPGCSVPNLTTLFSYAGNPPADVVKYTAPSGATIFSTGSLFFTWGLDDWGTGGTHADPRLQQFMRNLLDDLSEPKARSAGTASTGAHR